MELAEHMSLAILVYAASEIRPKRNVNGVRIGCRYGHGGVRRLVVTPSVSETGLRDDGCFPGRFSAALGSPFSFCGTAKVRADGPRAALRRRKCSLRDQSRAAGSILNRAWESITEIPV
jgi:hypothetical protein